MSWKDDWFELTRKQQCDVLVAILSIVGIIAMVIFIIQ